MLIVFLSAHTRVKRKTQLRFAAMFLSGTMVTPPSTLEEDDKKDDDNVDRGFEQGNMITYDVAEVIK